MLDLRIALSAVSRSKSSRVLKLMIDRMVCADGGNPEGHRNEGVGLFPAPPRRLRGDGNSTGSYSWSSGGACVRPMRA
jgi:hypothetical protein